MLFFLKGNPTINALVAAIVSISILLVSFVVFEPIVTHSQVARTFTINQEITSEISFLTDPNDVSMDSTIQGLTGGESYGTTTFNISTNNPTGYNVTIAFSSTTAMQSTSTSSVIPNYIPDADPQPDYDFQLTSGEAWFAYTVQNETTPADIDTTFKDNGSNACNSTGTVIGHCWFNKADATVAEQIIDSSAATVAGGATSSVTFRVGVGANPSPSLETGWYRATATLTATTNP